ncbi:branched-chain amino acid ABC transporter permease [Thauera linaloolentis]|uniref:Branched-chain amino acid ABC transporter permease n=1 Tax=Thauera linaloolentis (strain DSM 12138 / JCM 21573 / CCUG 41526 / CIP 105981 / IAM 15112 / NBRC 102519 / 47Lol) TaxID=1123367 RepID=N6XUL3_THAL4|nr:branched-chain amino acid ABC transporter permease [Thauera linaloolentis]ENO85401.1 branched-chain amino acid ABC transporter permease [Thauera linaloolentis 47Lol = DSM 12138]MCM8564641.1 branched-chain amino acid ABC transporter permease [Thauera linaloolentis]
MLLAWGALLVFALVWLGADFAFGQATLVATYAIAGLGVVVIVGQAGQIVLGQGAFVALGAYAQALLVQAGMAPLAALPFAILAGASGGALASLPAGRLGGLYFGMSTLAFALIVEEALVRWESLTHGAAGLVLPAFGVAGSTADTPAAQAALSIAALLAVLALCARLLRSRLGRAWRAVREDEAAAAACGIAPGTAKLRAFAVGGGLSGLAGGLYAHWIGFISPEQFGLMFSFELLMLAFIGGARHLSGAAWGALVVVAIPQLIAVLRDALPGDWARSAGLELVLFGAVVVGVVLLRPQGLAGGGRG